MKTFKFILLALLSIQFLEIKCYYVESSFSVTCDILISDDREKQIGKRKRYVKN
jgi:hypothetical protein